MRLCVHAGMFMYICVSKSPEGMGALNDTSMCADKRMRGKEWRKKGKDTKRRETQLEDRQ